ncbi:hypothetical protein [Salinibacter ruber]|uniref:hypothetical protein n=1 Tax=Salinibacter ruber TaxID=146919 RepID=UPI0021673600|nr:hypothetical protein [Salinibacter ruber]MCS4041530.1 hypothetical protein [Salinibacter ruber]
MPADPFRRTKTPAKSSGEDVPELPAMSYVCSCGRAVAPARTSPTKVVSPSAVSKRTREKRSRSLPGWSKAPKVARAEQKREAHGERRQESGGEKTAFDVEHEIVGCEGKRAVRATSSTKAGRQAQRSNARDGEKRGNEKAV